MRFSNHKDIKLVTNREIYVKIVMKPNFKRWYPLSKVVFAAVTEKTEINHGQAILDISKTLTYEFRH